MSIKIQFLCLYSCLTRVCGKCSIFVEDQYTHLLLNVVVDNQIEPN